jgi:hypothetical protein
VRVLAWTGTRPPRIEGAKEPLRTILDAYPVGSIFVSLSIKALRFQFNGFRGQRVDLADDIMDFARHLSIPVQVEAKPDTRPEAFEKFLAKF